MNKNKLLKTLKDLGLSDNEALVYFSALGLGPTTIKRIAETSGVKRTSIYNIVEDLKKLGLMHIDMSGLKQRFVAENPVVLSEMLERRKTELQGVLPDFQKVYDRKAKQSYITFIEGIDAVQNAYRKLPEGLKRGDPYYIISNTHKWYELYPDFADRFIADRSRLGLDIRMLTQDSKDGERLFNMQKNSGMKLKFLPKHTTLNTNLVVNPKRVLIQQLTFPIVALQIENESIIQMHQQLFEIMWNAIPE